MVLRSPSQIITDIGARIPMRDGVELVADIYRPTGNGAWPVIMQRNPYDRTDPSRGQMVIVDPFWLARQGFVVIVQDTRGRGESEGEFDMVYQEVDDGYDSIEWAAAQPWSTGAVGVYGSSYMGISTYQAAASRAPHLRAAVAFVGTPDSLARRPPGGMFHVCFLTWYALLTTLMTVQRLDTDPETKADLEKRIIAQIMDPIRAGSTLPLTDVDVIDDASLAPFWHDQLHGPEQAAPSNKRTLATDHDVGEVALLHITGYRDFIAYASFELAKALANNPKHRFIAGPWTHRGPYSGATGARELPGTSSPAGSLSWGPLIAAWFDIHLRDGDGSEYPLGLAWLDGDPIRYYIEGENRWASAPSWPPAGKRTEWQLTSNGNANSAAGDGRILRPGKLPRGDSSDEFQADPLNPFPTCGGALGMPEEGPDGIQDQRAVDNREDVLVYTSDVLSEPLSIAGAPQLAVQFSSSVPDADVCVTLVDVEPNGFAYNVSEGWQRTRYRKGGTVDWLEPGQVEEVVVALHDTAHVFRAGHRIRVMIAGANFPHLSRNLHTKTIPELGTIADAVVAAHTIHHGPSLGSRLVLPEYRA